MLRPASDGRRWPWEGRTQSCIKGMCCGQTAIRLATAGTQRWEGTDTTVQVFTGLFSTTLGDGTAFGTLFATYPNLWLEVAVDLNRNGTYGTDETYAPRQKMAGAAWAMDADTLDGLHVASLQRRVTGTAPAGRYITAINADGTVATRVDAVGAGDITAVTAGTGLLGGATAPGPSAAPRPSCRSMVGGTQLPTAPAMWADMPRWRS